MTALKKVVDYTHRSQERGPQYVTGGPQAEAPGPVTGRGRREHRGLEWLLRTISAGCGAVSSCPAPGPGGTGAGTRSSSLECESPIGEVLGVWALD